MTITELKLMVAQQREDFESSQLGSDRKSKI